MTTSIIVPKREKANFFKKLFFTQAETPQMLRFVRHSYSQRPTLAPIKKTK
jgi:hypothetical protein